MSWSPGDVSSGRDLSIDENVGLHNKLIAITAHKLLHCFKPMRRPQRHFLECGHPSLYRDAKRKSAGGWFMTVGITGRGSWDVTYRPPKSPSKSDFKTNLKNYK